MQLDFASISAQVPFQPILDHFNIPYEEHKDGLKAKINDKAIIINPEKRVFLCPQDKDLKGGVINLVAHLTNTGLREAAKWIKDTFMTDAPALDRKIPELALEYCEELKARGISHDTARRYGVGFVKQKSIMSGKVAFKAADHGYVGFKKDGSWFFPKGFKRDFIWNAYNPNTQYAVITADLWDCLHLLNLGFSFSCSLMGSSMTEAQQDIITANFKRIILVHKEPMNILARLTDQVFVKVIRDEVQPLDYEQIKARF